MILRLWLLGEEGLCALGALSTIGEVIYGHVSTWIKHTYRWAGSDAELFSRSFRMYCLLVYITEHCCIGINFSCLLLEEWRINHSCVFTYFESPLTLHQDWQFLSIRWVLLWAGVALFCWGFSTRTITVGMIEGQHIFGCFSFPVLTIADKLWYTFVWWQQTHLVVTLLLSLLLYWFLHRKQSGYLCDYYMCIRSICEVLLDKSLGKDRQQNRQKWGKKSDQDVWEEVRGYVSRCRVENCNAPWELFFLVMMVGWEQNKTLKKQKTKWKGQEKRKSELTLS